MKLWDTMHASVCTRIASPSTQVFSVLLRDPFNRGLIKKLLLETQKDRAWLIERKFKVYYSNFTKRNEKTKRKWASFIHFKEQQMQEVSFLIKYLKRGEVYEGNGNFVPPILFYSQICKSLCCCYKMECHQITEEIQSFYSWWIRQDHWLGICFWSGHFEQLQVKKKNIVK